jgi:[acyl-carrier-protein] S-malonyltransferase
MAVLGVSRFIEIGPGKVLSGLVKRITREVTTANVEDLATLKALTV